jgi:hypothetical protein
MLLLPIHAQAEKHTVTGTGARDCSERAQRLLAAIAASRAWYDDIFDLHRIAVGSDGALWWAEGAPPALALGREDVGPDHDPSGALLRMERHAHGTIADSFGLLDLTRAAIRPAVRRDLAPPPMASHQPPHHPAGCASPIPT